MTRRKNFNKTENIESEETHDIEQHSSITRSHKSYAPSKVDPLRNEMNLKHYINNFEGFATKKQRIQYNEKRKKKYLHSLSPEIIHFKNKRDLQYILYSLMLPEKNKDNQNELYNNIRKMTKIELINEIARLLQENIQIRLLKWKRVIKQTKP